MSQFPEVQAKINEFVARIKRNQVTVTEDNDGLTFKEGSHEYHLLRQNGNSHSRSGF